MKYALIGCGMICANHIRAALETGLEIVALCDLVEENREKALAMLPEEKRSGVKLYADYRAMLSEQRPALTAVALGSGIKRQIVCDCLKAGTNVIVEKPVALSLEDADAMIEAAAKNGVKLCVNHQLRFCRRCARCTRKSRTAASAVFCTARRRSAATATKRTLTPENGAARGRTTAARL